MRRGPARLVLRVIVVVFALALSFPFYWMALTSFKRTSDLYDLKNNPLFFNDPPTAFTNLRRWLVPGGHFAFAVWGPVVDNPWMTATRTAVAEVIDLAPLETSAPGPFRYGDVAALVSLLGRAGFVDVAVTDWRQTLPIGDRLPALDAAQFALAAFSSFAELLSNAGGDAPTRARRALAARFTAYEQEGTVLMPARVHIITGRVADI